MTGRRRGLISRVVTGLLLVAGFAVLSIGFAIRFADLHFQTVLSNSMRPTL
jgi:signal peptidase I